MSAELGTADGRLVAASATAHERSRDRRFFTGMAVAAALTAFAGFARSYYLKGVFGAPPPFVTRSLPRHRVHVLDPAVPHSDLADRGETDRPAPDGWVSPAGCSRRSCSWSDT